MEKQFIPGILNNDSLTQQTTKRQITWRSWWLGKGRRRKKSYLGTRRSWRQPPRAIL